MSLAFDHLDLKEVDRRLIRRACGDASVVYLAPLDKGLSGSSLWHARWLLQGGVTSKDHVFKIGPHQKLEREHEAIDNIVSVIEPSFPHVRYIRDDATDLALLRQEFVGEVEGEAISLRKFVENCDPGAAGEVVQSLYLDRMKHWHPPSATYQTRRLPLAEALDWWVKRMKLREAADQIGSKGLYSSLNAHFGFELGALTKMITKVLETSVAVPIGPVHGDLHAQNVLLDSDRNMQLIDFGWTNQEKWKAIDFLMMECSLKFVVSPAYAMLDDLLKMDDLLDSAFNGGPTADYSVLSSCVHGAELGAIAQAVHAVRYCALTLNAITDLAQYRLGLIALMAGLTSLPTLINRVYLFHSIGYHLVKVGRTI